ncbi:MAG: RNase P subunit p30 family protein [Candidatus Woesearchaeota archaeon]
MQDLTLTKDKGFENKLNIETKLVTIIDTSIPKLRNIIQKAESPVIIQGGDEKINRLALENKKVDILLSPEKNNKKDSLFFRNSGLNQVLCKLAKKNDISIGFNFSDLLNTESKERTKILGRMFQNARLCKKYKVNMVFTTLAKNKYELRSKAILDSFKRVITL